MNLPTWPPNSFYSKAVQSALSQYLPGDDKTAASLAYPIQCFVSADKIAECSHEAFRDEEFLWLYSHDPIFCSRLLYCLTLHHHHDRNKTAGEIAYDVVQSGINQKHVDSRATRKKRLAGYSTVVTAGKKTWKELADIVNAELPSGNKSDHSTLRTSIFPNEKKRRQAILEMWKRHFDAFWNVINQQADM